MKSKIHPAGMARPRLATARTVPPAGLDEAFRLIQMDGFTPSAAPQAAAEAYQSAQRVIAYLNGQLTHPHKHNDLLIQEELEAANRIMHPPTDDDEPDPATTPQTMAIAGFHVGFAVCWLLLTAVNGKDGAR